MRVLLHNDYLEVRTASLLADYDRSIITNLYQPIIGFTALALYFNLWTESENQRLGSLVNHGDVFKRMGLSASKFVDARKALEGTGLLRTYINTVGDTSIYTYILYAPKQPKKFFDDALLCGMLIKSIGQNDTNKLKTIYTVEKNVSDDMKDITASFVEVFHPDFDDPAFQEALKVNGNFLGRNSGKINSEFSYELFFDTLSKISQITSNAFTKKDMKEIERLATLHGVDEIKAANAVNEIYDANASKGKHVDFSALTKIFQDETNYRFIVRRTKQQGYGIVSGSSDLANKVNQMEVISPKDYLSVLQGGTKPATSDLRLINDMSKNFQLPNGVINAIVDFTLTVNNNVLSRSYVEKICASVAREGIMSAHEAMNYLKKVINSNKKHKKSSNETNFSSTIIKEDDIVVNEDNATEEPQLSWEELMERLTKDE